LFDVSRYVLLRFQYLAYALAFVWYMLCIYFSLLLGVTFTKSIADAWLLGFAISIFQDLVVMETLKLGGQTGVKLFVKPQIAVFLASQVASKYQAEAQ